MFRHIVNKQNKNDIFSFKNPKINKIRFFQMALPDDYVRIQQIFGSLAKKDHPMSKFFWGNLESLQLAKVETELRFL